jgi:hypothetical protein
MLPLIITGCINNGNNDDVFKNIPSLALKYTINDTAYDMAVPRGTVSWHDSETGFGIQADSPHPLDYIEKHLSVIEYSSEINQIELNFSHSPDYFIMRRWPDKYMGLTQEYSESFETVDITGEIYILSASDKGHIYEIAAKWPQGSVSYVFCIR